MTFLLDPQPLHELAGACYHPRAMSDASASTSAGTFVDTDLKSRIRHTIVDRLRLEVEVSDIDDAAPLFGDEGLGLDSIDALELVLGIEQEFGVRIEDEEVGSTALASVDSLAEFIASQNAEA